MKFWPFFAWILLGGPGCGPPTFDVTVQGETTIAGEESAKLLGSLPPIGSLASFDFGDKEDFKSEGISKGRIESVRVQRVSVRVVSPSSQSLAFLDFIQCFVHAGEEEELLAEAQDIPSRAPMPPELELDSEDSLELKPFALSPQMGLRIRGQGRTPPQDTTLRATFIFRVTAEPR